MSTKEECRSIEDTHLDELIDYAIQGIGECSLTSNRDWGAALRLTFRLLSELGLLRKITREEDINDYIINVRSTAELIERLESEELLSSPPLWFFNEVAQVVNHIFPADKDAESKDADRYISLDYLRALQLATCAVWCLGFGAVDENGQSEFAKRILTSNLCPLPAHLH
jgi:hypothetical protein